MVFASSTRRNLRAAIVTGLIAATASACAQDQDFVVVERAVWFTDREACALSGSEDTPLVMSVDVAFNTRIGMGFVVTNNQSPNPNSNTGIDDSEIVIESAEVNLSFTGGGLPSSSYEASLPTNSIPGGSSQTFLIQVPTEVSEAISNSMAVGQFETLEMAVVFKGRKYGQAGNSKLGEVETRTYVYPFEICKGCLTDCAECGVCPTATEWVGTCGFAQGLPVYHPSCDTEDNNTP